MILQRFVKSIIFAILSAQAIAACSATGCSGEVCGKLGDSIFSVCIWKAEYICYKQYGICEVGKNGECQWRQTKQLLQCIKTYQDAVNAADPFSD